MPVYADPLDGRAIAPARLEAWTAGLIGRLGTPPDIASDVAALLLASDRRGIASHGTARLPQYVSLVEAGVLDPEARPDLVRRRLAIALLDARNGWGHHASRVATDLAIEGARQAGTFTSVVRRSNHFGIAGWYAIRVAEAGMIGISLTNSSPLVAPTRARVPMLGTNPIAVAARAGRHGIMCLDMATSTIPRGRIEVAARRGEALQAGWAIDRDGRPALTPDDALEGALQPLGGAEETGGYKGYGLGLVVDLLTGILAGAHYGPGIVPLFSTHEGEADLGQAFIAIDPAAIDGAGAFEARLEDALDRLVAAPTIPDAPGRVLVPGAPEAAAERRADEVGVVIDAEHHAALAGLAERFDLPLPEASQVSAHKGE
jgi:LDH2 family malate/lactate/ureidoglycolate dehydrogenase